MFPGVCGFCVRGVAGHGGWESDYETELLTSAHVHVLDLVCEWDCTTYSVLCLYLSLSFFPRFVHVVAYITTASWDQNHGFHYEYIYVAHFVDAFII